MVQKSLELVGGRNLERFGEAGSPECCKQRLMYDSRESQKIRMLIEIECRSQVQLASYGNVDSVRIGLDATAYYILIKNLSTFVHT